MLLQHQIDKMKTSATQFNLDAMLDSPHITKLRFPSSVYKQAGAITEKKLSDYAVKILCYDEMNPILNDYSYCLNEWVPVFCLPFP